MEALLGPSEKTGKETCSGEVHLVERGGQCRKAGVQDTKVVAKVLYGYIYFH